MTPEEIQQEIQRFCRGLFVIVLEGAKENPDIAELFPNGIGMTMFLFGFGDDKSCAYASNAKRKDMIEILKEFIERLERE